MGERGEEGKNREAEWRVVNKGRKRRERVNEEIKMEWDEYFRGLLGGVE